MAFLEGSFERLPQKEKMGCSLTQNQNHNKEIIVNIAGE